MCKKCNIKRTSVNIVALSLMFSMNIYGEEVNKMTLKDLLKLKNNSQSQNLINNDHANHNHDLHEKNEVLDFNNKKITYVCPMHPQIISDSPGSCPICGMDLVLKKSNKKMLDKQDIVEIDISGKMQQSLGIKTKKVVKKDISNILNTFGEVSYNERNINTIYPRISGWIESVNVYSKGDKIKKGQLIYTMYSPELIQAQDDYLLSLNTSYNKKEMIKASERKLLSLGFRNEEITKIKNRKKVFQQVPFYAKNAGIVTGIDLKKGDYVNEGKKLLEITDLNSVWIHSYLFEKDQAWVKENQKVVIYSNAFNEEIKRKIDYIYPELDSKIRSKKIRIESSSLDLLTPKMLVNIDIYGDKSFNALVIPRESLISTEKSNRVVVKTDQNSFQVKEIKTGKRNSEYIEVLSGLSENDNVVISGQFLLDSESSLRGAINRIEGEGK